MTAAAPRRMPLGVLALCFVMGLLARALPDSFAVYVVPLGREFGWHRAEIVLLPALRSPE